MISRETRTSSSVDRTLPRPVVVDDGPLSTRCCSSACVVFVDALVGEKGLLETVKKRQEFQALEQSIRARAPRTTRAA